MSSADGGSFLAEPPQKRTKKARLFCAHRFSPKSKNLIKSAPLPNRNASRGSKSRFADLSASKSLEGGR